MKPLAIQPPMVRAISEGRLTKYGSMTRVRAPTSQPARRTTSSPRRLPRRRARSEPSRARVALPDFISKVLPDLLVEPSELLPEADLDDIARPRDGDGIAGLDPSRAGREHDHLVGERDGLLEVVGDEEHGVARLRPEVQQLVLHHVPRLDVQSAEGLVHEENGGPIDQGSGQGDALAHAARELMGIVALEPGQTHAAHP